MKAKKETALVRSVSMDFTREGGTYRDDGIHMSITPLVHGGSGVLYAVSLIVPQPGTLWHTWLTTGIHGEWCIEGCFGFDEIPRNIALFASIAEAAAAGMSKAVLHAVEAAAPF